MKRLAILLVFSLGTATAAAQTRYVSDELVIMMRSGQGNQFRIIQQLPSGTRLEVLEESDQYVRVRTPAGKEGWVQAQHLINEPVAAHKLVAAQKKLQRLAEENKSLQAKLSDVGSENGDLNGAVDRLSREKNAVEKELESLRKLAAKPAQLHDENQRMKGKIAELEAEVKRLGETNTSLKDRSQRDWFLTGAGVLGGGIFLGLVLPLLRRRKSSGFDLR